jgi:small subunit ribosomal protein S5
MRFKERMYGSRVKLDECGELNDKTLIVDRVSKVVKGGRRFSFSAVVVTGDAKGHFGYGHGKAGEVPEAIRKASEGARRQMLKVPMKGSTIPHDVIGRFGSTQVVLKPAAPGTGVIAGGVVRAVAEAAGITDIRTKCLGSNNPQNVLKACINGLISLRDPNEIAGMRNKTVEEMGYEPY